MVFAAYETTRQQIGGAMAAFAAHPAQWTMLASHPGWAGRPPTKPSAGARQQLRPPGTLPKTSSTMTCTRLKTPRITGPVTWRHPIGVNGPNQLPLSFG